MADDADEFLPAAAAAARGKWSVEEDNALRMAVEENGAKNWKVIAQGLTALLAKLGIAQAVERSDVQCLHRWQKVLKPGLVKVRTARARRAPPAPAPFLRVVTTGSGAGGAASSRSISSKSKSATESARSRGALSGRVGPMSASASSTAPSSSSSKAALRYVRESSAMAGGRARGV